ncbi:unnamed protein product, partial [Oikopleura dioica]
NVNWNRTWRLMRSLGLIMKW